MRKITYCDAINEAIMQEMQRDDRVFVYGIDCDDFKKIFNTTKNIVEKFGKDRCFSTPLSEDSLLGFGLGSAINGLRPINIHIRVDFLLLALNQLINIISSFTYSSRATLSAPIVIRAIIGRGWGQGFQHSKSLFSLFAHIPGLKVIVPTTAYDAKGLLTTAIRDNNPVICFEHRWLYWQEEDVPEEFYTIPFGESRILREGNDLTIIATSWMNVEACHAADILKKVGINIEVVDPRTLMPLSQDMFKSVKKTKRCLIVDNDWVDYGASAEIAAQITEECFNDLKMPVKRMGFAHIPCPTARHLENKFYPNAEKIVREVENMLKLTHMDLSKEDFFSHEHKFIGPF